jgi:high-affinity Fe2+/Pb2+ permease
MKNIVKGVSPYILIILASVSGVFSTIFLAIHHNSILIGTLLFIVTAILVASAIWIHSDNNVQYEEEKRRKEIRDNILKN